MDDRPRGLKTCYKQGRGDSRASPRRIRREIDFMKNPVAQPSADPRAEYTRRLEALKTTQAAYESQHRRLGITKLGLGRVTTVSVCRSREAHCKFALAIRSAPDQNETSLTIRGKPVPVFTASPKKVPHEFPISTLPRISDPSGQPGVAGGADRPAPADRCARPL